MLWASLIMMIILHWYDLYHYNFTSFASFPYIHLFAQYFPSYGAIIALTFSDILPRYPFFQALAGYYFDSYTLLHANYLLIRDALAYKHTHIRHIFIILIFSKSATIVQRWTSDHCITNQADTWIQCHSCSRWLSPNLISLLSKNVWAAWEHHMEK